MKQHKSGAKIKKLRQQHPDSVCTSGVPAHTGFSCLADLQSSRSLCIAASVEAVSLAPTIRAWYFAVRNLVSLIGVFNKTDGTVKSLT